MRSLGATLLLITITALARDATASGCMCQPRSPACEEPWKADAFFVGRVASITPLPNQARAMPPQNRVTLQVLERFRGEVGAQVTLVTFESSYHCGVEFERDATYVVYASIENGVLRTSTCSRTKRVEEAEDDVAFGRGLATSRSDLGRVFGRIVHRELDLPGGYEDQPLPAAPFRVTTRIGDAPLSMQTDATGAFESSIPPGVYAFEVETSPDFYVVERTSRIDLRDARACARLDITVSYNGRVSGRVVAADDMPLAGVQMTAKPYVRSLKGWRSPFDAPGPTDADGRYVASHLAPGRYRMQTTLPAPAGVGAPALILSVDVEVTPGGQQDAPDLRVPALTAVPVTGIVLDPDGAPAAGASVRLEEAEPGTDPNHYGRASATTGVDGRFVATGFAGRRYRLYAWREITTSHVDGVEFLTTRQSSPLDVTAGASLADQTLPLAAHTFRSFVRVVSEPPQP